MKPEFFKKKLKNGLTILFEKRNLPVVSISANVMQGSGYENEKEKGISHFCEHLLFKGTKKRAYKEIASEIEKKGGILNGYTDEEVTGFWNKIPSKHFSSGMEIVSDLILNPRFDKKEFEKEKKVILEEIKMYRDNPQAYVLFKIKEMLYKKPFGIEGIGTEKSVSGIKREEIIKFYNSNYKTGRMILGVVGNTSIEEVEDFANRFPKTQGNGKKIKIEKVNKQVEEIRKGIDQANLAVGFHISSLKEKNRYNYEIFNAILASGMSSKLFEEIREKRGLAYGVKGMIEQGKDYGYYVIYIGTTKDKVKLCKEIVLKEIKNIKNLKKRDLEEAKEQLIGLRKVESEESVGVMNELVQEEIAGNADEYYKYDERINEVKLDNIKKISKLKSYSSFALVPE